MKSILAIDPGAHGALVVLTHYAPFVECIKMPDTIWELAAELKRIVERYKPEAWLELVGGYVGEDQPGSRMFNFGENYGAIQGALCAFSVPLNLTRPQKWQQGIPGVKGLVGPKRKRALKAHAEKLFPEVKVTLWNADALLIADYAQSLTPEGRPLDKQKKLFPANRDAEAVEWAKRDGWEIPARGTNDWVRFIRYYITNEAKK